MDPRIVRRWTDAQSAKIEWLKDYVSAAWEGDGVVPTPAKTLDREALKEYERLTLEVDEAHAEYVAALKADGF